MFKNIGIILFIATAPCYYLYGMQQQELSLLGIDSSLLIAAQVQAQEDNRYLWLPHNVETLIKNQDINAADNQQNTRLHYAVLLHKFPEAKALIKLGADATKVNIQGQDPLALVKELQKSEKDQARKQDLENAYHQVLAALATQANLTFNDGQTLLHKAVEAQNLQLVEELLAHGADPNARNNQDQTPLHYSVINFQSPISKNIVEALLKKGANPDLANSDGQTAAHFLAQNYFFYQKQNEESFNATTLNMIDTLFDRMLNKNHQDLRGNTPLYVLVAGIQESDTKSYAYRLIKRILVRGTNPNIQNNDGFTPLHAAVNNANLELIELLLAYGANPHLRSYAPRTQVQIQQKIAAVPDKTPRDLAIQNRTIMKTIPFAKQLNIEHTLKKAEEAKVAPALVPTLEQQAPAASSLLNALDQLTIKLRGLTTVKE